MGLKHNFYARRRPIRRSPYDADMPRLFRPPVARGAAWLLGLCALSAEAPGRAPDLPSPRRIDAVRAYVKNAWTSLTRSVRDLPRAAEDPKFPRPTGAPWPVYVSCREDRQRLQEELRRTLGPEAARIELRTLPADPRRVEDHGLLYLPRPYVVPGGRFNEMYGWDSYFIELGLVRDGEVERARDMVDNFVYEVLHYGTILNANRTYYLSRSQPPFLTGMILGVFAKTHDREWLRGTLSAVESYYEYWTTLPHLVEGTGLSRYFDLGDGPAPEVARGERDAQGRSHYDRVREAFRSGAVAGMRPEELVPYYDRGTDRLTDVFFKADRSMRESGFDPSARFGPFGIEAADHVPVCLNALLFRMEEETAQILEALGEDQAPRAREWRARAQRRREAMDHLLWDEEAGEYFDYNFRTARRRGYSFATTFYPLWVGAASPHQAERVHAGLSRFEAPGGLLTSAEASGMQWDAPFGWAPLQLIAVQGLRRYGYDEDADRLAAKFISLVVEDFERHGTIVEKYDVRRRSSDVAAGLRFGYGTNEIGFGWTNAVWLELLADLSAPRRTTR
jgi:alpha,alpha-trehalase